MRIKRNEFAGMRRCKHAASSARSYGAFGPELLQAVFASGLDDSVAISAANSHGSPVFMRDRPLAQSCLVKAARRQLSIRHNFGSAGNRRAITYNPDGRFT